MTHNLVTLLGNWQLGNLSAIIDHRILDSVLGSEDQIMHHCAYVVPKDTHLCGLSRIGDLCHLSLGLGGVKEAGCS